MLRPATAPARAGRAFALALAVPEADFETPAPARLRPLAVVWRAEVRVAADFALADLPDPAEDFDAAALLPCVPVDLLAALDAPDREEDAREEEARSEDARDAGVRDPDALAPLLLARPRPWRLGVASAAIMSEASPVPDAARCDEDSLRFCLRPCDAPERVLPPDFLAPVAAIVHSLPFRPLAVVSATVSRPHGSACDQLQCAGFRNCILHAALP